MATRPVRAAVHLTRGLLATAEEGFDEARKALEDAVDLFEASGAPFEASRARLELAAVLLKLGRNPEAADLAGMALEALTALGAAWEAERARSVLAAASGSVARTPGKTANGLTPREVEVLRLLAQGMRNQGIAEELVLSVRTVQRHVENIYAKTGARGRAAAVAFAASNDLL